MLINSFQNNEMSTAIAILSVLKNIPSLEITKVLLIDTLLSYKSVRMNLKKKNSNIRSIEELVIKNSLALSNFNQRFKERFTLSINAIFLLQQLKLVQIDGNKIIFTGVTFDFNNKELGKFTSDLISSSDKLADILSKEEVSKLYLCLRIEL